jgi:Heterokaryon incompatibility protein (HET)
MGYAHEVEPSKPRLPTRVVDVGPGGSSLSPSLLETNGQRDDYLRLSYCWGNTTMASTTSKTLSDYKKSIPITALAKTIRDSLIITKKLGYRYIWIDSLCIVQDSTSDWERESSWMAMIYRHYTLTTAASGARSADEGCFLPRKAVPAVKIPYRTREGISNGCIYVSKSMDIPTMYNDTVISPLAQRAWSLQEHFLSRRILFYGRGCLHWACTQRQVSETREDKSTLERYSRLGKPADEFSRTRVELERPCRGGKFGGHQTLYREWYKMIGEYTTRSLTPAINCPRFRD